MQIHYATTSAHAAAISLQNDQEHGAGTLQADVFEIVQCPRRTGSWAHRFIAAMRSCGVRMALRGSAGWRDFRGLERWGVRMATMDASSLPPSEADGYGI